MKNKLPPKTPGFTSEIDTNSLQNHPWMAENSLPIETPLSKVLEMDTGHIMSNLRNNPYGLAVTPLTPLRKNQEEINSPEFDKARPLALALASIQSPVRPFHSHTTPSKRTDQDHASRIPNFDLIPTNGEFFLKVKKRKRKSIARRPSSLFRKDNKSNIQSANEPCHNTAPNEQKTPAAKKQVSTHFSRNTFIATESMERLDLFADPKIKERQEAGEEYLIRFMKEIASAPSTPIIPSTLKKRVIKSPFKSATPKQERFDPKNDKSSKIGLDLMLNDQIFVTCDSRSYDAAQILDSVNSIQDGSLLPEPEPDSIKDPLLYNNVVKEFCETDPLNMAKIAPIPQDYSFPLQSVPKSPSNEEEDSSQTQPLTVSMEKDSIPQELNQSLALTHSLLENHISSQIFDESLDLESGHMESQQLLAFCTPLAPKYASKIEAQSSPLPPHTIQESPIPTSIVEASPLPTIKSQRLHSRVSSDEIAGFSSDYDDALLNTQLLQGVRYSQVESFNKENESSMCNLENYKAGGSLFCTSNGKPIKIDQENMLICEQLISETAESYEGAMDATAKLRAKSLYRTPALVSTIYDISSMRTHIDLPIPSPPLVEICRICDELKSDDGNQRPSEEEIPGSCKFPDRFGFETADGNDLHSLLENPHAIPKQVFQSPMTGFKTAAGNALPPVSDTAIAKWDNLLDVFNDSEIPTQVLQSPMAGFITAGGNALPPVSDKATAIAENLMDPTGFKTAGGNDMPLAGKVFQSPMSGIISANSCDLPQGQKGSLKKMKDNEYGVPSPSLTFNRDIEPARTNRLQSKGKFWSDLFSVKTTPFGKTPFGGKHSIFKSPYIGTPARTPLADRLNSNRKIGSFQTPVTCNRKAGQSASYGSSGVKNTPYKAPKIKENPKSSLRNNKASSVTRAKPAVVSTPDNRLNYCERFKTPSPTYFNPTIGPWTLITGENAIDYIFENGGDYRCAHQQMLDGNCNPKICTIEWVKNHYKWIVWKMAALANRLGETQNWNFEYAVSQLMFRNHYECEKVKRSALKMIVERDESPERHMVLFISKLRVANSNIDIKLSDGWYEVSAQLDIPLTNLAISSKLFVGQKLHIQGAMVCLFISNALQLNSSSSEGCGILEAPESTKLCLFANCTRRAKWTETLGFQSKKPFFQISISSIISNGGKIAYLDVLILRKYPLIFSEKLSTRNYTVIRNAQEEDLASRKWNQNFQNAYEKASRLFLANTDALTSSYMDQEQMRREILDIAVEEVPRRNVTPGCTIRVCDYNKGEHVSDILIIINHENQEFLQQFSEGTRFRFFGLSASAHGIYFQTQKSSASQVSHVDLTNTPFKKRSLCRNFLSFSPKQEIDACLVVLESKMTSKSEITPQEYSYTYKLLCTDESLQMLVLEVTVNTEKYAVLPEKKLVLLFMNILFIYEKPGYAKFTVPHKTGIISNILISPYIQETRMKELTQWLQSKEFSVDYPRDVLAQC